MDGVFVILVFLIEEVFFGDFNIVKVENVGVVGFDVEFFFFFGDVEVFYVFVNDEGGDIFVFLFRFEVGENNEEFGFYVVGDLYFVVVDFVFIFGRGSFGG